MRHKNDKLHFFDGKFFKEKDVKEIVENKNRFWSKWAVDMAKKDLEILNRRKNVYQGTT